MFITRFFLKYQLKDIKTEKEKEEFKEIISEIFGYSWSELEKMNILHVCLLFLNLSKSYPLWINKEMSKYFVERATFFNDDGILNEEKVKKQIKRLKEKLELKNGYNPEEVTLISLKEDGELVEESSEIEKLFDEIKTYQNFVKAYVNSRKKIIYLTMVEYSMDYFTKDDFHYTRPKYEKYGIEESGELRLFLTEERYWPKDKKIQEQMKAATNEANKRKKENKELIYYTKFAELFEYRYASDNWVNYFFNKNPKLKEKYKGYEVVHFFHFNSVVSSSSRLLELPLKGEIK